MLADHDGCLRLIRALAVETRENWLEPLPDMDDLKEHKKEPRMAA
jgi:hypothetical protein